VFEGIVSNTEHLVDGMLTRAKAFDIPMTANTVGGMFGLFFTGEEKVTTFKQVTECDIERFKKFFHAMLEDGVYLAPSAYEAGFVSAAHGHRDIKSTLVSAENVFSKL